MSSQNIALINKIDSIQWAFSTAGLCCETCSSQNVYLPKRWRLAGVFFPSPCLINYHSMFNLKLINLFLPEITKSFLDYKDVVVDNDDISREGSPHHVARILGFPSSKQCPAMRSWVSLSAPPFRFLQKINNKNIIGPRIGPKPAHLTSSSSERRAWVCATQKATVHTSPIQHLGNTMPAKDLGLGEHSFENIADKHGII